MIGDVILVATPSRWRRLPIVQPTWQDAPDDPSAVFGRQIEALRDEVRVSTRWSVLLGL